MSAEEASDGEFEYGAEEEGDSDALESWQEVASDVLTKRELGDDEPAAAPLPPKVMKATTSSSTALMLGKEMVRLQKMGATSPDCYFVADFVDDNVFLWAIKFTKFPEDSQISQSLNKLEDKTVDVEIEFTTEFPMKPPKVSIRRPIMTGSFIFDGALCLELLLDGWRSSYTVEAVCMQILAVISENATVTSDGFVNRKDTEAARKMIKQAHAQGSWCRRLITKGVSVYRYHGKDFDIYMHFMYPCSFISLSWKQATLIRNGRRAVRPHRKQHRPARQRSLQVLRSHPAERTRRLWAKTPGIARDGTATLTADKHETKRNRDSTQYNNKQTSGSYQS